MLIVIIVQDAAGAKDVIIEFLNKADIVKISDADLEYLYDIKLDTALINPCAVSLCPKTTPMVVYEIDHCTSLVGKLGLVGGCDAPPPPISPSLPNSHSPPPSPQWLCMSKTTAQPLDRAAPAASFQPVR